MLACKGRIDAETPQAAGLPSAAEGGSGMV